MRSRYNASDAVCSFGVACSLTCLHYLLSSPLDRCPVQRQHHPRLVAELWNLLGETCGAGGASGHYKKCVDT